MIKLDSGNVLLKPSHRKQIMSWLKRSLRLGERLGNFLLTITLHRTGHVVEVRAEVRDSAGQFECRHRQRDWRDALRDLIHSVTAGLCAQRLARATA